MQTREIRWDLMAGAGFGAAAAILATVSFVVAAVATRLDWNQYLEFYQVPGAILMGAMMGVAAAMPAGAISIGLARRAAGRLRRPLGWVMAAASAVMVFAVLHVWFSGLLPAQGPDNEVGEPVPLIPGVAAALAAGATVRSGVVSSGGEPGESPEDTFKIGP